MMNILQQLSGIGLVSSTLKQEEFMTSDGREAHEQDSVSGTGDISVDKEEATTSANIATGVSGFNMSDADKEDVLKKIKDGYSLLNKISEMIGVKDVHEMFCPQCSSADQTNFRQEIPQDSNAFLRDVNPHHKGN